MILVRWFCSSVLHWEAGIGELAPRMLAADLLEVRKENKMIEGKIEKIENAQLFSECVGNWHSKFHLLSLKIRLLGTEKSVICSYQNICVKR